MRAVRVLSALAFGVLMALPARAAEPKKLDLEAESKQAADEGEQQMRDRINGVRGKYQRSFHGTFYPRVDNPQETDTIAPDVVGVFVTDDRDQNPNVTYLVKVGTDNTKLLDDLKTNAGKKVNISGDLRNDKKYLLPMNVTTPSGSEPVKERRSRGGI